MAIALTRSLSPEIIHCELTHLERSPIDFKKAQKQHLEYENSLTEMGYEICRLPDTPHLPDSVFVEDTAIVLSEIGIISRPGAESRREETETMEEILKEYRTLYRIRHPGTLDGGDILVIGKHIYAGLSARTNQHAIDQLKSIVNPFGYHVTAIPVTKCLHLKTGIAVLEDDLILINPDWIDPSNFPEYKILMVHPAEPYGANVMRRNQKALCPQNYSQTGELLKKLGYEVLTIDQSELAKAEAGLTCCSVIIE